MSLKRIVLGLGVVICFTFVGAMVRGIFQISHQTRNGTLDGLSPAYFLFDALGLIVGFIIASKISRKIQK